MTDKKIEAIKRALDNGAEEFSSETVKYLMDEIELYKKANVVELQGWKGKSGVNVYTHLKYYKVIEYRKTKETGEVKMNSHEIKKSDVGYMRKLLSIFSKKRVSYREIVRILIKERKVDCSVDAFNGGTNRSKYYFPLYYYPIKILENHKEIHYSGGGIIKRVVLLDTDNPKKVKEFKKQWEKENDRL